MFSFIFAVIIGLAGLGDRLTDGRLSEVLGLTESYDLVVAKDGSGDYATVSEAIAAAPEQAEKPIKIFIKKGRYEEQIVVPKEKPHIHLIGEDAEETVITYNGYVGMRDEYGRTVSTQYSATAYIRGNDFLAKNLTFENSYGTGIQALAMYMHGDRGVFYNVRFLGWQDTLRVEDNRSYFKDCYIEGHVDYIYGSGTAVFENSVIYTKTNGRYITASSAPIESEFGMVFLNSKITGSAAPGSVYLGRPWKDYAATVFINCEMDNIIHPAGWHNWGSTEKEKTARYAEYGNTGPGADTSQRVAWAKQLTDEEASRYTVDNILAGKDGWNSKAALKK